MIGTDYGHTESEIGGPGVKQAVDRFHGVFRDYFELEAVYRQGAHLTRDVGGTAGTDEFTNAVIANL